MNGPRIARRTGVVLAVAAAALVIGAQGASAADGVTSVAHLGIGDTHGIDSDRFTISVNDGNRLNVWDTKFLISSEIMKYAWELYKGAILGSIVILQWVMQMDWVAWLLTPLTNFGLVVDSMLDRIGIAPLMLMILGFLVAFWWFRGRIASGFTELIIGCTIAALSTVYLANPTAMIAGDDGLITSSRDAGMDMATSLVTNGQQTVGTDPSIYLNGMSASLVDTMIRTPHQILNYGSIIDGTPCEAVYNEAVGTDDARKTIGACNEAYKLHTDAPDAGTAVPVLESLPTALIFMVFVFGMVALVVLSVISAGWAGVKILISSPMAVVPGAPRAFLFKALGAAATAAITIAGLCLFVVLWMRFINAFYQGGSGLPWLMMNRVVWVLLIAGPIVYSLFRRRIAKAMSRAGDRLAKLGPRASKAAQPVVMPKVQRAASQVVKHYVNQRVLTDALGLGNSPKKPEQRKAPAKQESTAGPAGGRPGPTPQGPAGAAPQGPGGPVAPSGTPAPTSPTPGTPMPALQAREGVEQKPSAPVEPTESGDRLKQRLKTAGTAAVHLTALVGSGGTSTIAEGASAAIKARQIARAGRAAADLVASSRTSENAALRRKLEVSHPRRPSEATRPAVREAAPRKVTEATPGRQRPEQPRPSLNRKPGVDPVTSGSTPSPVARRIRNG